MRAIDRKDVVILSNIEWDFQWQRHQIFTTFFCDSPRKVVFIESQAKRNPDFKDIPRILKRLLRFIIKRGLKEHPRKSDRASENLIVISPLLLPSTLKVFRTINRKVFIPQLVRTIHKQIAGDPMVINYTPIQTSIDLIKSIKPLLAVYDCVENFPDYPGVPKDTAEIERTIIKEADLVVTDSIFLFEKAQKIRNDVIRILPGVDYLHFQQADTGELKNPPRRLCYFGGVHERRIDLHLIEKLADSQKFTIEMIGPVKSKIPPFPSNVIFHGAVPYEQLPGVIKDCDCFILPYILSEFTKGILPAKLFECFASGKPIIATPLPSFREFNDLIYLGDSGENWIKTLETLENLESEHKYRRRKALAQDNSWESRFREFRAEIEKKVQNSGS
jgi:glycosyltransferase involved in cell wall biosynthesis